MKEEIKFEQAMEKLEQIVSQLESGEVSLEDALKKYEEGVRLSRLCTEKLNQAERKIELLTRTLSGEVAIGSFDASGGAPAEEREKGKRKKASSKSADDGGNSSGELSF